MPESIAWREDLMGRAKSARFLTSYIDAADDISVVNINSPWGTGKTFFLSNWRAEIFSERATVYFNAWENDFNSDPLVAIVANIRDQLEEYLPKTIPIKRKLSAVASSAGAAIVATAPIVFKQVAKKFTGVDTEELSEVATEASEDNQTVPDMAAKFVEELIKNNKANLDSVDNFKNALTKLIDEARARTDGKPVYIFIDELDRCRPTYSIELLERVKHFFSIPGCKFIIATDTTQLAHSIKAVYGAEFASTQYLKRFFDLSYSFPKQGLDDWISFHVKKSDYPQIQSIGCAANPPNLSYRYPDQQDPHPNCVYAGDLTEPQFLLKLLAETFNTDLRQLKRIIRGLSATEKQFNGRTFNLFFAAYLTFLMHHEEAIFSGIFNKHYLETFKELILKYPSPPLYFSSTNLNIHEIARSVVMLCTADQASIRRMIHDNNEISYIQSILVHIANRDRIITKYPELVSLSAGIQ